MEIQFFVTLMTSAIGFAGQVLSAAISKVKNLASDHIFDKPFLEKTIADSTHKLAELLDTKSEEIKQEMKDESVRESIRDVQAHVASLRQLLGFTSMAEMNPQLAAQLVISALSPLHVSLEKTKLCLLDYEKEDLWSYCHVIGVSTLIAGYAYLGQDMPSLREELEKSIREAQVRMLNSIADMMVQTKTAIPWEQVPRLLSTEGINELSDLYISILQVWRKNYKVDEPPAGSSSQHAKKLLNFYSGRLTCSICNASVEGIDLSCPRCHALFI